jgi:glycosyltransferase involved in cell wall biosynthesis
MTTDAVGGVWTYVAQLCEAFSQFGIHVDVASMGPAPTTQQRARIAAIAGTRLFESEYKLEWMDDPWPDVDRAGDWLLDLAREVEPDVVHLNGYCHGSLPFDAPVCVVAHSCVWSWWFAVFGEPAPARYDEYRRRVRAGLGAASQIVAPTRAMLEQLTLHYGALRSGVVIPNGIDGSQAGSSLPDAQRAPSILAAGRVWDAGKNLMSLASTAAQLSWPVRIAGEGAESVGLSPAFDNVAFLGRLEAEQMRRELERARIFAHPARYEPFGLAPLEAAAHGCALVLGDIPSLREVWGDAALYVPPNDRALLVRTLQRLIDDPRLRKRSADRARAHARRYTALRSAGEYVKVYERLVADGSARRALARERAGRSPISWAPEFAR